MLHILHLEDEPLDSEVASELLRREGLDVEFHRVFRLRNFREALEKGGYALILADYMVPGVAPLAALTAARELRPDVPFIYLSGTIGEDEAIEALKLGASDYVFKQRIARLAPAVKRALREAEEQLRRRQAETALRQSEERFRAFMDNSPTIAWAKDEQGRHVYLNKAYERRFGVRLADWQGKTDFEVWPAEIAETFRDNDLAVMEGDRVVEVTEETPDAAGGHAYWWNFKFSFRDGSGNRYVGGVGIDVTERKRLEEQLRESELKATAVLNATTESIFLLNRDGNILIANDTAARRMGKDEAGIIGENICKLLPSDLADTRRAHVEEVIRSGEPVRFEDELAGTWLNHCIFPIHDGEKQVTGVAIFSRDVTEQRRAEEESRKFRFFSDSANDAHLVIDEDTGIVYANKLACERLGYTEAELLRLTIPDIDPVFPKERVQELFERLKQGRGIPFEAVHKRKDGSTFPVEVTSTVLEIGGRWQMFSAARDITERKRHEAELEKAYTLLRAVTEGVSEAIFVKDLQSRYVMVNGAGIQRFGKTHHEEVLGKDDREFFPPDIAERIRRRDCEVMEQGKLHTYEEILLVGGSQRVFLTTKAPHRDADGTILGVLGISRDITERKEVEEKIRRLNESLELRVEKRTQELREANESLQAFAHTAAHDLRSPLRAVSNFSNMVIEQYGPNLDEMGRSMLERVKRSAEQMAQLLNDLLDYSKMSQAELALEKVRLQAAVSESLALLEADIRAKNGKVTVKEPLPDVCGHHATVVLLISNLVSNALKFMKPEMQPEIQIWAEPSPGNVRLYVQDNGIGIAPEDQEKIFGVFQRLHGKQAYAGTGLGLAIVKKGAERMGGQVGVKSEEGKGSRFWLELEKA